MYICNNNCFLKEAMKQKENEEEYMGGFGGRKENREIL